MTLLSFPIYYDTPVYYILANYSLFFTCGLPGGIDYFLMYLVTCDKIQPITEKKWNNILNTWVRAPGIMYGAFICYQQYLINYEYPCTYIASACVLIWNAQYFSNKVAMAYVLAMIPIK